ncbi:TetR/AcrR family transcriptional regulator [Sphingopyxis sp. KK2]|uniref:TetR/AcrR family transcriptional regulator n=1 Tax=Sphingopyxis sp. KK2 TaxID=1855727 RepID=UPI00097E7356|nr:TetR/AcrR family transcriptional regulator [Sphingopyxis sp. KK2]
MAKRPPPGKRAQETRARILDASAEVFAEKGYALARLADIAAKLGVHVGGLYHYFGSREDIVREMLAESTRRGGARLSLRLAELPADASASDQLATAIDEHFRNLDSGDAYVAAWHRVIDQVPPEIRENHRMHSDENYAFLFRNIIVRGRESGEFSDELPLDLTIRLMLGALIHARLWYPGPGLTDRKQVMDTALAMFVRALR